MSPYARTRNAFRVRVSKGYPFEVASRISYDIRQNLGLDVKFPTSFLEADELALANSPIQLVREFGDAPGSDLIATRYLAGSLLKRLDVKEDDGSKRISARSKFDQAEALCTSINTRSNFWSDGLSRGDEQLRTDFSLARRFIRDLLGDVPPVSELYSCSRHGPGSSSQCDFQSRSLYFKFRRWPYECPPRATDLAYDCIRTDQRWFGALDDEMRHEGEIPMWHPYLDSTRKGQVLRPQSGNRVCYVPKTRQTYRTIAIESSLGVYLQLGVDGIIRRRLRQCGVDLNTQVTNQQLARKGSLDGWLSTCDLSSASDTVSLRLCEELLPPLWFKLLYQLRADTGVMPEGDVVTYQKISSMGNGYTFALESLIFYSLCQAVWIRYSGKSPRGVVNAYGDDLVFPSVIYNEVNALLSWCGFILNRDKSFTGSSPFRESCGRDWWRGRNIRPVFIRSIPEDASQLLQQHNMLWQWFEDILGLPPDKLETLEFIKRRLPSDVQCLTGPRSEDQTSWLFSHDWDRYNGRCVRVRCLDRISHTRGPTNFPFGRLMCQYSRSPVEDWSVWSGDTSGTKFQWEVNSSYRIRARNVFVDIPVQ
jgi:hypothetical protein